MNPADVAVLPDRSGRGNTLWILQDDHQQARMAMRKAIPPGDFSFGTGNGKVQHARHQDSFPAGAETPPDDADARLG